MVYIHETNLNFNSLSGRDATKHLVIHHTGGNAGDDYSAQDLHAMHQRQGWSGVGYHFIIRKNGAIEQGRPAWSKGAHSVLGNNNSIGIHVCGNFELEHPATAQIESLAMLAAHLCDKYNLDPQSAIIGHRDQDATACPGRNLYNQLSSIRGKTSWYFQQEVSI